MKNQICLMTTTLLFIGVYGQNIEHFDQGQTAFGKGQLQQLPIKYEMGADNQQEERQNIVSYDDFLQLLESQFRRKRTNNNDISDVTDDLFEIFPGEALPLNINFETTPPWAIQILAVLKKIREKCSQNQSSKKPRPGRRSVSDEDYAFDRNRPLSPRRGKKSLFKPRMGRSAD